MVLFTCHFKFDMVEISRLVVYHQAGMSSSCLMRSHHCLIHYILHFPLALLPCCSLHMEIYPDPRPGAEFGRFAEQSSFAGYEPNDRIEVDNSEVTPMFFPRRTSRASLCNSGEDVAVRPAQTLGMLASPLSAQESEASADPSWTYRLHRENSVSSSSFFRSSAGKLAAEFSRRSKSSRESHSDAGQFAENIKKFRSSWKHEQIMQHEENRKLYPNSLKRSIIREFFLKNKEAKYSQRKASNYFCRKRELSMPPVRYKFWTDSFPLMMRKYADDDRCSTRTRMTPVRITEYIKKLAIVTHKKWKNWRERKICVQMNYLDKNCRKRQFSVNAITAQIQELQDKVICMNDSR